MSKYDSQKTNVLYTLRRQAGRSQSDAAKFLGLKGDRGRERVGEWEGGHKAPDLKHRSKFIYWLWDELGLRRNPELFGKVWKDVMVGQWRWLPFSESELRDANQLVPPSPPHRLVGLDDLRSNLKQRLFAGGNLALALIGLPGIGKTTLAIALANDPEVRQHFRDGVLWADLGRDGDVLGLLGTWGLVLGISLDEIAKLTSIEKRADAIHARIGTRRMLLVVNDAWQVEAALAFRLGGPNCAHLATTRFPEIAAHFAGQGTVTAHELNTADGMTLLAKLAPKLVEAEPDEAQELVQAVGGLPLALVLMGHYLRKEAKSGQPRRLHTALDRLRQAEERPRLDEPQTPELRHTSLPEDARISVEAVIAISDEALDEASRYTLRALSIFPPKPNTFSEEAAIAVSAQPVETLDQLYNYGLLESGGPGRYMLHQTIADYARQSPPQMGWYDFRRRMQWFFISWLETHKSDYALLAVEMVNVLVAFQDAFIDSHL